eukprot:14122_1
MSSVLAILAIFAATVSSECNYAVVGDGEKYPLDFCLWAEENSTVISRKITCSNNNFTLHQYSTSDCTGTADTHGPDTPAAFQIDDYSCTGTIADCDFSLALLYMAESNTSCGDSSSSVMNMTMPMFNDFCSNGTIFEVTSCEAGSFALTRKEYTDSECTMNEEINYHTEGVVFDIDGGDFCIEVSSDNLCNVYTAPTTGGPTLAPTLAPTSKASMVSFEVIAVVLALVVLMV